jgi:hypothetical protein
MDDNQWCQHDIMCVIIMELDSIWKWVVLNELQLSCNELHRTYITSWNFVVQTTCSLTFTVYEYNELQGQLQNLFFP